MLEPSFSSHNWGSGCSCRRALDPELVAPISPTAGAGQQLSPKHRADGGINTVIQRGFVNTKNKQARRCVLEGHVQAQHFRGQ